MLFKLSVILCLLIVVVKCQNWRERRPNVRISQGTLEGIKIYTDTGRIVNAFLGIPYAAPPVGNLRFTSPQKHPGWNGTYNATSFGSNCPQLPLKPGINDQENCLYLNIWSPESSGAYAPLPVVLFLEGKNFAQSNTLPISGQDFATEGLIVITINYRLNVFGFFCLGNSNARGNFGMLDQYFALLWIKENIKEFGGDPEKITIYGHLSGAVSVTLHMVSPRTSGLFQRAIMSSGSAISPWHLQNNPIVASKEVLRMLGCDSYTVNPVTCLRTKRVEHILQAYDEYSESFNWNDKFLPTIDTFLPQNNQYLPISPDKALKDGTYLQVPVLTGISKPIANEQFMQWMELASEGFTNLQQYIEKAKIPEIIRFYKFPNNAKEQIFDLIKWKYFSFNQGDVRILFDQLKNLEYDGKIEAPHYLQLSYLMSTYVQPIYVYYLDDLGFVINSTDATITTDILLLFGPVLLKQVGRRRFNSNELALSKQIKKFWLNFIIFGNPTPNNQLKLWRKYTTTDYYVENLGLININNNMNDIYKERTQTVLFWNQLLTKILSIRNNLSINNNIPRELQNSPDPAAGFRHAMYTLVALVIALLALLLICIVLLKKRAKERERHLHMVY